MSVRYTIKSAAAITGLSPHTIRAWEKRYGALSPDRTETNRRLYEEEDIERMTLLRRAVEMGHGISQVAKLPADELRSLSPAASEPSAGADAEQYVAACEAAIDRLSATDLEHTLLRAAAAIGVSNLLEDVVIPLISVIDRRWAAGTITVAQEHLASAALRTYLEQTRLALPIRPNAPRLLVTTPKNQFHEIGALIVAIAAALAGWNVTYLGPNLPAAEIAAAAKQCGAKAIGLSIVYPDNDPAIATELAALRREVGATPILVGGRAAMNYWTELKSIDAKIAAGLSELRTALSNI